MLELGTDYAHQSGRNVSAAEDTVTIVDESPVQSDEMALDHPPQAIRPELERALRREIERALQPVLADFRTQSVRAVRQQVDEAHQATPGERREEAASV